MQIPTLPSQKECLDADAAMHAAATAREEAVIEAILESPDVVGTAMSVDGLVVTRRAEDGSWYDETLTGLF